ncbi:MAG: PDZ domain-containing protein, partial [Thermoanaerobaculaceae bacterium]|nr:PDZ domain-containing protein [Thermoanaerobaculaceae bacterium]
LTTGEVDSDEDESAPTARLMDLASSLKDGDVVTLEYRRGGATATATLTARSPVGPHVRVVNVPRGLGMNGGTSIEIPDIPDMPDIDIDVMGGRAWRDVDLIALNPELGQYFGSSDGVLVVRAPKESSLKLQGGDVILKIGDRTPATPTQAMRILRSYEPGEKVELQVLRKHEKVAVEVQVPERRHRDWGHAPQPAAPAPPAPPAAPAPPAPPAPGF